MRGRFFSIRLEYSHAEHLSAYWTRVRDTQQRRVVGKQRHYKQQFNCEMRRGFLHEVNFWHLYQLANLGSAFLSVDGGVNFNIIDPEIRSYHNVASTDTSHGLPESWYMANWENVNTHPHMERFLMELCHHKGAVNGARTPSVILSRGESHTFGKEEKLQQKANDMFQRAANMAARAYYLEGMKS